MCVIRLFASSGQSSALDVYRRPGPGHFDAAQVEAMLATLPFEQKAFLEAVRGDLHADRLLWGWLCQKAAQKAAVEAWLLTKGMEPIGELARLVKTDMLRLDGKHCSGREASARLMMAETTWRASPWPERYQWLGVVGDTVVRRAAERLRSEFYD